MGSIGNYYSPRSYQEHALMPCRSFTRYCTFFVVETLKLLWVFEVMHVLLRIHPCVERVGFRWAMPKLGAAPRSGTGQKCRGIMMLSKQVKVRKTVELRDTAKTLYCVSFCVDLCPHFPVNFVPVTHASHV